MLTDNEKLWLEKRRNLCTRCYRAEYCRVGKKHHFNTCECKYWQTPYLYVDSPQLSCRHCGI